MKLSTIRDYWDNANNLKLSVEVLNDIHRLFVHETVFSSIDILLGKKPAFDSKAAYEQVVVRREGGTCRLINLAAKHLLEKIGFTCECISSDVHHIHNIPVVTGSAIHMTMLVSFKDVNSNEIIFLFDPGFGNAHRVALPLGGEVIEDVMSSYRVTFDEKTRLFSVQEKWDDQWLTQFEFNPHAIMDQAAFDQHTDFIYKDTHFYRNNLYVQQCGESGATQLYNDQIRVLEKNGVVTERSVLAIGGTRRALLKIFKLPQTLVDSMLTDSSSVQPAVLNNLRRYWDPSPLVKMGSDECIQVLQGPSNYNEKRKSFNT